MARKNSNTACGNASPVWVQHIVRDLLLAGLVGFVLTTGSMPSNQSDESDIRQQLIKADLVDCLTALSSRSFFPKRISFNMRDFVIFASNILPEAWKN
jgi:type I restriction-modification system DNA methylase subunit